MRRLLVQLDGDRLPSSFDRIVASDAGAEEVLSYGAVAEADMKTQSRMGEARVLGLAGKKTEAAALYRLILKETPETPLRTLVEIQLAQSE